MASLELFLQFEGDRRVELIRIAETATPKDVIAAAVAVGFPFGADVLVFAEGEEPLVIDVALAEQGVAHRHRVHVHRCRRIAVSVRYAEVTYERAFVPAATVEVVKRWFVHEIKMSPVDASEHVLQLTGTVDRPDPDTHIGTLVCGVCSLDLTLVPIKRVEG